VHDIDLGDELEELAAEVPGGGERGRRIRKLAGFGARERDQLL